jgi:hypothetical protein
MAQHLRILESLWAKEGAGSSGVAAADQLAIRDAGFDGAGVRFIGPDFAGEVASFLRDHGNLAGRLLPDRRRRSETWFWSWWRGLAPTTATCSPTCGRSGLKPAFRCWRAGAGLGEQAGVAVQVKTHRDRMTPICFHAATIGLLPDQRLTADVSHYLASVMTAATNLAPKR